MADLKTDLAECVRLHGAATEGPWDIKTNAEWSDGFNFFGGRDGSFAFPVALEPADRDLLQALHNLFHDHGDELLAVVRDAERWRAYERELPNSAATVRDFLDAAIAGRAGG